MLNYNSKSGLPEDIERMAKIQKIIHDTSVGSKYYEYQESKKKKTNQKIIELKKKLQTIQERDPILITRASIESLRFLDELETMRDNEKFFVHFDLDAFFAAVECLKDPSLQDVPMAVGGNSMLCTANYVARTFGVTSGMPGFIAKKICPSLIIKPLDHDAYIKSSNAVMNILRSYDANLNSFSMDEASLDFTSLFSNLPKEDFDKEMYISKFIQEIRTKIMKETGITVSAGIAPTRPLAKMVSNRHKPNGQYYLQGDKVLSFLKEEPIKNIHGIGQVTCHLLKGTLEVEKCKDIIREVGPISLLFNQSKFLFASAIGIDLKGNDDDDDNNNDNDNNKGGDENLFNNNERDFGDEKYSTMSGRKSMSVERTVQPALTDILKIENLLKNLCVSLSEDLKGQGIRTKNLTLKMKSSNFQVITRSITLETELYLANDLYEKFKTILHQNTITDLRLLGIRAAALVPFTTQKQQKPIDSFLKVKLATVNCPICSFTLKDDPLIINEHIDNCLK